MFNPLAGVPNGFLIVTGETREVCDQIEAGLLGSDTFTTFHTPHIPGKMEGGVVRLTKAALQAITMVGVGKPMDAPMHVPGPPRIALPG
jgi:hypothetical protein